MARAVAHGISRGAIAKARGQTFRSGFWSGFASSAFSPGSSMGGDKTAGFTLRTSIASVVGGTASKLGGGKFANGAVSGAFVHMFNTEAQSTMTNVFKKFNGTCTNNGYFLDKTGVEISSTGYISSNGNGWNEIHGTPDEIGFSLSILSSFPTPLKGAFSSVSLLIDAAQGDVYGLIYGGIALTGNPIAVANDIRYGYNQAYGQTSSEYLDTNEIFKGN